MTVDEALSELTAANFHSEERVLRERIIALEVKLQRADTLMTQHASQVGSMHAWWDDIVDIRSVLRAGS